MARAGGRPLGEVAITREITERPRVVAVSSGAWRFITGKPLGAFGAFIILALIIVAIFAPAIATHGYANTSPLALADPFSSDHFLGTDSLGRDVFSRIVYGTRIAVLIGFGGVAVSILIAYTIGTVSGYCGGLVDLTIQRLVDAWMAIPSLVLLLTIVYLLGDSPTTILIAIGIILAGGGSRVARSAVLAVKGNMYVEAARTIGAGGPRIIIRHILPNVFPVMIVSATVQLGVAILLESSLSFLGYGIQDPEPSWGGMLSVTGRTYMLRQPWLSVWPGVAIVLAVYSFNMLGDAVRDIVDPRLRGARR